MSMTDQETALHIGRVLMAHNNGIAVYFDDRFIGSKTEIEISVLLATPERFVFYENNSWVSIDGKVEAGLVAVTIELPEAS